MGVYNIYGEFEGVQLKVGSELELKLYKVGEEVDIPDGVYVGYEGVVVVLDGRLAKVFPTLKDKWGGEINYKDLIRNPYNF